MKTIILTLTSITFLLSGCHSQIDENSISDKLKDGTNAPALVKIPSGKFTMGCLKAKACDKNEMPAHEVKIESFFVSQTEITFAQWKKCHEVAACPYLPQNEFKDDSLPVFNISWNDAQKYINWLSTETGKNYRLLSESEWEYVAKAGSKNNFFWGDDVGKNQANCANCGSRWDGKQPAPVKSFKANKFGVYDMHGNLWEWTQDCWHADYQGAPSTNQAWQEDSNCQEHMMRGGSYFGDASSMESSNRTSNLTNSRLTNIGFRIARS